MVWDVKHVAQRAGFEALAASLTVGGGIALKTGLTYLGVSVAVPVRAAILYAGVATASHLVFKQVSEHFAKDLKGRTAVAYVLSLGSGVAAGVFGAQALGLNALDLRAIALLSFAYLSAQCLVHNLYHKKHAPTRDEEKERTALSEAAGKANKAYTDACEAQTKLGSTASDDQKAEATKAVDDTRKARGDAQATLDTFLANHRRVDWSKPAVAGPAKP